MKRIAVLTSGGDAPGMNAAIRAVVRMGIDRDWQVLGVRNGYTGLVAGEMAPLGLRDVGGIIQLGGTILGSSRCPEFEDLAGQAQAVRMLEEHDVDALVVIGGNGSQTGAYALQRLGFSVVGVASTIDNDLYGADPSVGVDSALNVALEAIDRLKATASSHQQAFLVEVMGRQCGYLALMVGIAGGAEAVVIPEQETDPQILAGDLRESYRRGKTHALVVVAEGARLNAHALMDYFQTHPDQLDFELRLTILGSVQRGGAPSAYDRLLATRLGAAAVEILARDESGVMLGQVDGDILATPLETAVMRHKPLDPQMQHLARVLAH